MRVAIVVQRFGEEIIGGAEAHARMIAIRLQQVFGWNITVLTSTARDYTTWANHYDEGLSQDGPLQVRRFPSLLQRNRFFFGIYHRIFSPLLRWVAPYSWLSTIFQPIELLWYLLQGPFCPGILTYLQRHNSEYHVVFFFTYLYFPTAFGISKVTNKAILIPTAHNEPPFFFPRTAKILAASRCIFANTDAERDLIARTYPEFAEKCATVGIGLTAWSRDEIAELRKKKPHSLDHNVFLLYLGRISRGKGVDKLCENFLHYLDHQQDPDLILVFAGQVDDFAIPEHPQIKFLGQVNDQEKFNLIACCVCLVNPSPMESMSLVLLEALSLRRPVLANGHCAVFAAYAKKLATVTLYRDATEFCHTLATIREGRSYSENELSYSEEWVHQHFSWNSILTQYQDSALAVAKTARQ